MSMASLAVAAIAKPNETNRVGTTTPLAEQSASTKASQPLQPDSETPTVMLKPHEDKPLAGLNSTDAPGAFARTISDEVRRGGWMVIHAYGETADAESRRRDSNLQSINIAV